MKKILLFVLILSATGLYAQQRKTWGAVEVGYGFTMAEKGGFYDEWHGIDPDFSIRTLKLLFGYYIIPDLSVGAGIGLNGYLPLAPLNTTPLWLDLRYHPFKNKKLLLNSAIGHSFFTPSEQDGENIQIDIALGYKVLDKRIDIIPAIGYNYCNYSMSAFSADELPTDRNQNKHSLFAKVSVMF
jgi:hypothetical protein